MNEENNIVSEHIKALERVDEASPSGFVTCGTCGKRISWEDKICPYCKTQLVSKS